MTLTIGTCDGCGGEIDTETGGATAGFDAVRGGPEPPRFDVQKRLCPLCVQRLDDWFAASDERKSSDEIAQDVQESIPTGEVPTTDGDQA